MAKIKTKFTKPLYSLRFEVTHVSSPAEVTREGFTVRTDRKVLRSYLFQYSDGSWSTANKILWRTVKELPESLEAFQNLIQSTLEKMGYTIVKVSQSKTH